VITVTVKKLAAILKRDHSESLGQWYCDLNCYRNPKGFPFDLGEIDRDRGGNFKFRKAFDAVCLALGEEGQSYAWWLIELGRTESEWREWWHKEGAELSCQVHNRIRRGKRIYVSEILLDLVMVIFLIIFTIIITI